MADDKIWRAIAYIRISKDNGEDTLDNQLRYISEYINLHHDIEIVDVKVDNGYSGTNCNRPAFKEMMNKLTLYEADCVVVRDLSRFSRNYLDCGKYIENIFPTMNVRLISIFENLDTIRTPDSNFLTMIRFRNLINNAYSSDLSVKIRTQLEAKQRQGKFIGSFATYGYQKDPNDKNHLIIDETSAVVVRDIFTWKLEGMSQQGIMNRLNRDGILSPMAYKQSLGLRYATSFATNGGSRWYSVTVHRILSNEVYTGVMEQGKYATCNFSSEQRVNRPKDKRFRVYNTHQAIISRELFDKVQSLLQKDTRTPPGAEIVYPLCGILVCGDCGSSMVRKTISPPKNKYYYYVCSQHRLDKTKCSSHSISENLCHDTILRMISARIQVILHVESALSDKCLFSLHRQILQRLETQSEELLEKARRWESLYSMFDDDLQSGMISYEDHTSIRTFNLDRINKAKADLIEKQRLTKFYKSDMTTTIQWISDFKNYQQLSELTRKAVVELIESVSVLKNHELDVRFRRQNEVDYIKSFLDVEGEM